MKFKNLQFQILVISISMFIGLISCSGPSDPYKPYLGHHVNYPQRVDTVIGYSGIHHVTLNIPKPSDPQVEKVGVFWRNQTDSLKAKFSPDNDTLQVVIDSLQSGSYTFEAYTYSKTGVKSPRGQTSTINVYGDDFANVLRSREISYSIFYNSKLYVYWGDYGEQSLIGKGTKIYYTTTSGNQKTVPSSPANELSIIDDYDAAANDSSIQYKTSYINSPSIADTFKTRKIPNDVDIVTPVSDLIATIVQYDDNSKWDVPGYGLEHGRNAYVDRSYTLDDVSAYSGYEGLEYIRPANDSKVWSDENIDTDPLALIILRNDIQGPIAFYVGLEDDFDSVPWLENENFHKTQKNITTSNGINYIVWKRTFQSGAIVHVGGIDANKNMCLFFIQQSE